MHWEVKKMAGGDGSAVCHDSMAEGSWNGGAGSIQLLSREELAGWDVDVSMDAASGERSNGSGGASPSAVSQGVPLLCVTSSGEQSANPPPSTPVDKSRSTTPGLLSVRSVSTSRPTSPRDLEAGQDQKPTAVGWKQKLRIAAKLSSRKSAKPEPARHVKFDDTPSKMVASSAMAFLPPLRRPRGGDINPTVNGLKCFGVSKVGITRAVVKFSAPPRPHPNTVCFHFPGTFITHRYVLDMARAKIAFIPDTTVTAIQFVDRNSIHGTQGLDNRWLITVSCAKARDELIRVGFQVYNRRIMLRRYDDILADEYKEFLQYKEQQKKLYARLDEMIKDKKTGTGLDKFPIMPSMSEAEIRRVMAEQLKKAAVAADNKH